MALVHYGTPTKKITITHGGATYQLEAVCPIHNIFEEENTAWNADMTLTDEGADLFSNKITHDDRVQIYVNYAEVESPLTSASIRFDGYVEDMSPVLTEGGEFLNVKLRAYSRCLLDEVVADQFGVFSDNTTLDTAAEILTDGTHGIVPLWVNKLLGNGADASGYTLDVTEVQAITGQILYLDFPYKPVKNSIDDLLDMVQAIKGSGTAGAHYIVKPEQAAGFGAITNYFILDTVGNHASAKWPTWWNTNQAGSTIVVKQDMIVQQFSLQRPEANYILYAGNFRKPGDGDYWTEDSGGAPLWGDAAVTYSAALNNSVVKFIVGSHSLLIEPDNAPSAAKAYYPGGNLLTADAAAAQADVAVTSALPFRVGDRVRLNATDPVSEWRTIGSIAGNTLTMTTVLTNTYHIAEAAQCRVAAEWDFGPLSTPKLIPKLCFYRYDDYVNAPAAVCDIIYLISDYTQLGDVADNYFSCSPNNMATLREDKWVRYELPIGKYWALDPSLQKGDEASDFEWVETGAPDWSHINTICFAAGGFPPHADDNSYLDGLHFSGHLIRGAKKLTAGGADEAFYKTKVITDSIAKDDNLHATDDSGTMARIAYSELLRCARTPITGTIAIPGKPTILPGQKCHIHAVKTTAGTYRIDKDMRITMHQLSFTERGLISQLSLTDDLYNSRPMNQNTAYSLLRKAADIEYQNQQNSSVKSWAMDTTQFKLEHEYSFASSY